MVEIKKFMYEKNVQFKENLKILHLDQIKFP